MIPACTTQWYQHVHQLASACFITGLYTRYCSKIPVPACKLQACTSMEIMLHAGTCLEKFSCVNYSLMRGRIKGPRPLVNPMQCDKTFITWPYGLWVIKILHGNGAPKATNGDLRLATRMSLPAATMCSALTAAVHKVR